MKKKFSTVKDAPLVILLLILCVRAILIKSSYFKSTNWATEDFDMFLHSIKMRLILIPSVSSYFDPLNITNTIGCFVKIFDCDYTGAKTLEEFESNDFIVNELTKMETLLSTVYKPVLPELLKSLFEICSRKNNNLNHTLNTLKTVYSQDEDLIKAIELVEKYFLLNKSTNWKEKTSHLFFKG